MTLLVFTIVVPTLAHGDSINELADALNDLVPNFVSFFVSFAVIGRYWAAHHQFFATLAGADGGLVRMNLAYLAFIAFLPFPTALLGTYFENPLSVTVYAVMIAIVSGLEVLLFRHARRHDLTQEAMPKEVYRWLAIGSLSPVAFFLISVPIAFASTTVAVVTWFGTIPFSMLVRRWRPPGADRFFAP